MANYEPPHMSSIDQTIISVTVGRLQEVFNIHKALLSASSDNFAAALNGRFTEGQENAINLEDAAPETFRAYVDWLYSGSLQDSHISCVRMPHSCQHHWLSVYIFADRYIIPELKIASFDKIHKLWFLAPYSFVREAYKKLPRRSPMLKYVVDQYICQSFMFPHLPIGDKELPYAFLQQYFLTCGNKMREVHGMFATAVADVCEYHEHPTDEHRDTCRQKRERLTEGARRSSAVKGQDRG
ncbi:hypothetical protein NA57DRAFT_74433 [Rhizodiscina lignyota]|uniref:BTB domain-containing protein n=1 Tax=Rhizodiscina lignyota TaxID=1504668 RepID=A0A9P4IK72_9PEZI|nr:hypothetical protein NA57DRAFT_74433 [Rhizodiscina lignyota]